MSDRLNIKKCEVFSCGLCPGIQVQEILMNPITRLHFIQVCFDTSVKYLSFETVVHSLQSDTKAGHC